MRMKKLVLLLVAFAVIFSVFTASFPAWAQGGSDQTQIKSGPSAQNESQGDRPDGVQPELQTEGEGDGDGTQPLNTPRPRARIQVDMDNLLVKTNQAVKMSYTIPQGYEDDVTFRTADPSRRSRVSFTLGSDGVYKINPAYKMNNYGDIITVNAIYDGQVVGSCQVCFVPSISSYSDGVEYSYSPGGSYIYTTAARLPFATPTKLYANWVNTKLVNTGIPELAAAYASGWQWNYTEANGATTMEADPRDSSRVILSLCRSDVTDKVWAKPWINISGVDYLYNYTEEISLAMDSNSSPITVSPTSVYEGRTINFTFDISAVPGVGEDTKVTWTSTRPDILPFASDTGVKTSVTTQKGYIDSDYVGVYVTASAVVNGVQYTAQCSKTVWVWREKVSVDATVTNYRELKDAMAAGHKKIAVDGVIEIPADTVLDLSGIELIRNTGFKDYMLMVKEKNVTVTGDAGTLVNGYSSAADAGLVCVDGGELTISNIKLSNAQNNGGAGGAIYAEGGKLVCENVIFGNNTAKGSIDGGNEYNGGALYLDQGVHGNIRGNTFTANRAQASDFDQLSPTDGNGGAVYARLCGKVDFVSNTVDGCEADSNGGGLSVVVAMEGTIGGQRTSFTLSGNRITGCKAGNRGGGLHFINSTTDMDSLGYSRENSCIKLLSGRISGCSADWGGAIDYTSHGMNPLYLTNVIIRNNTAIRGGGVWACPTSNTSSYSTLGGAIYGNTATGAILTGNPLYSSGDDVRYEGSDVTVHLQDVLVAQFYQPLGESRMTVLARALGGGLISWYTDEQDDRFARGDLMADPSVYADAQLSFSLHGVLAAEYRRLAEKNASLIIENNTAESRGGGIASNSRIVIGLENHDLNITVNKKWDGNGAIPQSVKITLVQTDARGNKVNLDSAVLTADNGWRAAFARLPSGYTDSNGNFLQYSYTVAEEKISDWSGSQQQTRQGNNITITLTNKYTPGTTPPGGQTPNPNPVPDTSDTRNVGLWIVINLASAAVLITAGVVKYKRS